MNHKNYINIITLIKHNNINMNIDKLYEHNNIKT